jgi:hypothetical protein
MDNPLLYALTVGGIAAIILLIYLFIKILDFVNAYIKFYFIKHFFYHRLPKYLRLGGTTTWYNVVLIVVYFASNACVPLRRLQRPQRSCATNRSTVSGQSHPARSR